MIGDLLGGVVSNTVEMHVVLEGAQDTDQLELEALALQLRARLLELEVERVELARCQGAPDGSKSGEIFAVGALAVALSPVALRGVLRLLEAWMENRPIRSVRVSLGEDSIDLEVASAEEQQRLVDAFIEAHLPASGRQSDDDSSPSNT
ncbi:hypothetical protein ACFU76_35590 [Streptomyces sp. NPDC057539]|uniref:hypothetical protein n=1 Tax=Streptomyces sp. NPDC057539 TaxID=3346159 RepID=UPI003690DE93